MAIRYLWILCTIIATSTAHAKNDWLGRNCSNYVDADSWCQSNVPMSYCNVMGAGDCACTFGHHKATDNLGNLFCQKFSPDSKCTGSPNISADLACQSGMGPMARCDWTGFCECHSNETLQIRYVEDKGCVKLANYSSQCGNCSRTKGYCVDINDDGVADDCHCPGKTASSEKTGIERLKKGCDIGEASLGDFCNPNGPVFCSLPNSACEMNPSTFRFTCSCNKGFVAIPARWRPGISECVPLLTPEDDHNCTHCLETDGECFDNDGDGQMDGCLCPSSRTSSDPNNPVENCDFKHVEVKCKRGSMHVCYHPHNHSLSEHANLPQRLKSGIAAVYVRDHHYDAECIFKPVNSGTYCVDLTFEDLDKCGTKLSKTEMMSSYTNAFVVQWEHNMRTGKDFVFGVHCPYNDGIDIATARVVSLIRDSPQQEFLSDPEKLKKGVEDAACSSQPCWSLPTDVFIAVIVIFAILILLMVGLCLAWMTHRRRVNARRSSQEDRNNNRDNPIESRACSPGDFPTCPGPGAGLAATEYSASDSDQTTSSGDRSHYTFTYSASMTTQSTDSSPELQRHPYLEIKRCKSVDLGYISSRDLAAQDVTVYDHSNTSAPTDSGLGTSTTELINQRDGSSENISVSQILETPVGFVFSMEQLIANHKLKPIALAVSPENVNATIQYQYQC
ncbi:uncharacterized protein LOC135484860 [Lineus longissimus]|uniref:uncharacterized protein LOC135484860 n=1 Tax=Lineus longissimus TaxID=88925 RepID=UPI00315DC46B